MIYKKPTQLKTKPNKPEAEYAIYIMSPEHHSTIESFISYPPLLVHSSLSQLRYLILSEGLPVESAKNSKRLRCYVWSILSRTSMDNCTNDYVDLLKLGPPQSPIYDKIKNDTGRTLQTDQSFKQTVSEESLVRCLSCFAWQTQELENRIEVSTYVQGMNILLAPLLYTCPSEPMAFKLFSTLCYSIIPTYITHNLIGVANGAKLLDICLKLIDPKLSKFLSDNLLTAEIYGMASILTLSSCNKPLHQVCKLWDFMFAYGFHMNILFIIGMLVKIRKKIFNADSPMNLLKDLPPFDADEIIRVGVGFLPKIPSRIYTLLVEHLTNPELSIG
ncbi:mitotic check point protein Bub2p [Monosporozyma unispora]